MNPFPLPDDPAAKGASTENPSSKVPLTRFWRDGHDLVIPRQDATFTGRCPVTGKELAKGSPRECYELTATWMTWDINTLLLHLPFGFFTLWIFGSRGSVTISVDPAWRVKRTLFMTGMIGSLLLGAPLTLFITIPTLLLA